MPKPNRTLYDRLVSHYKAGRHREYLEEVKNNLKIQDDVKKDKIANALLNLHRKIIKNHSEYIMSNYGNAAGDVIHLTMKGILDHIELLNKNNPKALESDFLHKPVWGKKSILDLMAERVSKSPQSEYSRLVHISGTLVNHYEEISKFPVLHRMYAAALARGDDKVLKYINAALTIIKTEKPDKVDEYLRGFNEILKNKDIIRGNNIQINKRNVGDVSKTLLLLAAHSVVGNKKIPKREEELLEYLAKKIVPRRVWDKTLKKYDRKELIKQAEDRLKENIGMFTSYVLMNKSLYTPEILPKVVNLPEMSYREKDKLLNAFSSLVLHHAVGKEKAWAKEHIDNSGKLRLGNIWDIIKSHKTTVKVGEDKYKIIFDKLDPLGQINAIEKLQSCYTPPNEAAFHALSFILNPYKMMKDPESKRRRHVLVPGIARVVDKNGSLVGRFTVMIHVTPTNKIRLMVTSLPNGHFPRGIMEDFIRSFRKKIEKKLPNSTLTPIIADKHEGPDIKRLVFKFGEIHDDGIYIDKKRKKVYVIGKCVK